MSDYKPLTCLPVLALRGLVVFPGCVTHFDVGRSKSARAVEEAMRADKMIFLIAQRDVQCDKPKKADLYSIGTVAYVRQVLRLPGDNMRSSERDEPDGKLRRGLQGVNALFRLRAMSAFAADGDGKRIGRGVELTVPDPDGPKR